MAAIFTGSEPTGTLLDHRFTAHFRTTLAEPHREQIGAHQRDRPDCPHYFKTRVRKFRKNRYNSPFVTEGGEHRLLAKEKMMAIDDRSLPELVKEIRRRLSLRQEDPARELGISFATVNRREKGLVKPSQPAKAQLDNFCAKMTRQGKLKLTGGDK